jgi:acyl phosphate:glycerol-3-phosphate acyltransferase
MLAFLIALFLGYGLGSIPFGLLLTKLAGLQDIRSIGSGNIGATNVLRTGRKDLAIATLLLDALKGSAAVWLATAFFGPSAGIIAGIGAFLGHLYPVWLRFSGGKGVATYIGVLLALWWPGLLLFALLWLGAAWLWRYSSLAALIGAFVTPLAKMALDLSAGPFSMTGLALAALSALLIFKHKPNIARLIAGTEGKIGDKSGAAPDAPA